MSNKTYKELVAKISIENKTANQVYCGIMPPKDKLLEKEEYNKLLNGYIEYMKANLN